jgi:CreA protein
MTFRAQIHDEKRRPARTLLAFIILTVAMFAGTYAHAADEPDLIFRRSTVLSC